MSGAVRVEPEGPVRSTPPLPVHAARAALAVLLLVGSVYPHGPFEGKGMIYRLPAFLAPGLIVWIRHRRRVCTEGPLPYPVALDLGLTVPFLSDTVGNALGLFDSVDHFDSVMHTVNWAILCAGITVALGRAASGRTASRKLLATAGAGIGAIAIIAWEAMEYGVMEAGVAGLNLTYADTLGDLALSTAGGALGAWWAARRHTPEVAPAR